MLEYFDKGAIVKSTYGREKGELFIITKRDGNYVYLTNGKSRPLENPKKKNIKHIYLLNKDILKDIDLTKLTNAHMIKYLKDYNKSKDYK
jgi:ribosomal protein L14E/L6E/L27E